MVHQAYIIPSAHYIPQLPSPPAPSPSATLSLFPGVRSLLVCIPLRFLSIQFSLPYDPLHCFL